tara:strand:- start:10959 stop:11669 length:711 start_codon:yes stop_codon:yes gene_type:complete
MPLLVLPCLKDTPIANMAIDLWMLQDFPRASCPRFRHYDWDRPCHTFGYGQDLAWVEKQTGASLESLFRRPTGGGVVDHRNDWTYSLVIPIDHPAAGQQIRSSYQALHAALGAAMKSLGASISDIEPSTKQGEVDFPLAPGLCFEEPVPYDLTVAGNGAKVAGAAMKKSREGVLLQGSIQKHLVADFEWELLEDVFVERIADFLNTTKESSPWPDGWEDACAPFLAKLESIEWQRR